MNAVSILQDFSNDKLESVKNATTEFLQPVLGQEAPLGCSEAKGYGNFAVKFLHICVTKLKAPADKGSVRELLVAAEQCCRCYLKVFEKLPPDEEYMVPKLVYHILNSVKHEDYVADILSLSKHMFSLLSAKSPLSTAGEKITHSLFCYIWNLANKLGPKEEKKLQVETVLQLRKSALIYLSLLSDLSMLVERLLDTMSQVLLLNKDCKNSAVVKKCNEVSVHIFTEVLECLQLKKYTESVFPCLKVFMMCLEHLVKIGYYDHVEKIADSFLASTFVKNTAPDVKQLLDYVSYCYNMAARVKFMMSDGEHLVKEKGENSEQKLKNNKHKTSGDESKELELCSLVKNSSKNLIKLLDRSRLEESHLLHTSLHFLCSLLGVRITDLSCFSTEMIESLSCCVSNCIEIAKIILARTKKQETSSKKKQGVSKAENDGKIYQSLLMGYFKKLLLSFHQIQSQDGARDSALYDSITDMASEFEARLDGTEAVLTPKAVYIHRKNCAYICSKIGTHCVRQEKYEPAILLNTIVLKQLRICDSSNVNVLIESLVDCYIWSAQWNKAMAVIVETSVIEGNITSCVALWVKLKREALTQQQTSFLQRTLFSVLGQLDNHKMMAVELLTAEYNAWKKISRRNHIVEYYTLCELVDIIETGLERCFYLIELAKILCMTGHLYKTRSASAVLSEVIEEVDEKSPQSQAVLALANFTKYVVSHEDVLQHLNAGLEKEEKETNMDINETGDTNQNTPNRHKSDSSANQKTPDRQTYNGEPTNQGSCFTMATEKPYLKYLHKAVELWDECMGHGELIDGLELNTHIEALVACGTRLLAMKQSSLALKVLRLAQSQIRNLASSSFTSLLEEKLAKVLMLLGLYEEAEKLIISDKGDNHTSMSRLLLKAELHLLMGKKKEGMDILNEVLGQEGNVQLTKSLCLANGCAKRLLSMFLCFPGDHLIGANSQYLLTLANDAVKSHLSVIRLIDKTKSSDRKSGDSVDKWTSVLEVLQSLLHLCQLYRLIGLPRNTLCYLKEGLKISQAQGLSRWACEFLFEMLRVQSMEADTSSIKDTIDTIYRMLNSAIETADQFAEGKQITPLVGNEIFDSSTGSLKHGSTSRADSIEIEANDSPECFGFENLAVTPKASLPRSNITPGKDNLAGELDDCQKLKLAQVNIPQCQCVNDEKVCNDINTHRLCTEAGIVIVESLAALNLKSKAYEVLDKLLTDNKDFVDFKRMTKKYTNSVPNKTKLKPNYENNNEGFEHFEPKLKYLSLEANCIQAEVFGQEKQYNKVHQIWHDIKKLEDSGFFVDVLHSNILVARLALCEATSFLQSLQSNYSGIELDSSIVDKNHMASKDLELSSHNMELQETVHEIDDASETDVSVIQDKFEDMTLSTRKVTFKEQDEVLIVGESKNKGTQSKSRGSRKKLLSDKENSNKPNNVEVSSVGTDLMTPIKKMTWSALNDIASTPKSQVLSHTPSTAKRGVNLHTPWSVNNRKMDLDRLLEDSDDDMPVFPQLKPVTPKTDQPLCRKSTKSKTEPKKLKKKTANEPSKTIVCDLSKALQQSKTLKQSGSPGNSKEQSSHSSETVDKSDKSTNISLTCYSSCAASGKTEINKSDDSHSSHDKLIVTGNACKLKATELPIQKDDKTKPKSKGIKECSTKTSKVKTKDFFDKIEKDKIEKSNKQIDIFDFDNEASPAVGQTSKGRKHKASSKEKTALKSKHTLTKAPRNSRTKKTISEEILENKNESNCQDDNSLGDVDEHIPDKVKSSASVEETDVKGREEKLMPSKKGRKAVASAKTTATSKRSTRGKKVAEEIEVPRNNDSELEQNMNISVNSEMMCDSNDECEDTVAVNSVGTCNQLNISPQNIYDTADTHIEEKTALVVSVSDVVLSPEFPPIEILRGDRKPAKTKGKRRQRSTKMSAVESEGNGSDESETGVEQMRSSRIPSLKGLSGRLNYSPEASVVSSRSSGTSSPDQQDIVSALENVYDQIRRLAPYPRHSDICQILALHYLHTNPQRAAFLLSDSIAVTFRHQAMLNLNKKVRKQKTDNTEEVDHSSGCLESYVDGLFFNKDESNLQEMIDIIPSDWTVLQVSVVNQGTTCQQVLLTRFAKNQTPIVLQLPGFSSLQGRQILANFTSIIRKSQDVMKVTVKADWWKIRKELDSDMETLVNHMEKFWVGHWRGVFTTRQYSEEVVDRVVKEIKKRTKKSVEPCHVEILLHSLKQLSDRELERCASELLGPSCSSSDIETIISMCKQNAVSDKESALGHVVLILDKAIQHLPWECMPILKSHSVSRMPCLSHLYTQLNYLQSQESSIFVRGVNPEKTYYMVNPDNNLPNAESVFKDWFESEKGWKGIVGMPPTKEQFAEAITDHDLFIYCGHGSGGRYFHGDDVEKLQGRAAIILMGCSSGKLSVKGQLEPSGMMISYFLAGCPCMIANLWDVTDRDIDKYLQHLLQTWLTSESGTSLSKLVQESRQACKMKFLVGCAPVVYGLPVVIKK